MCTICGAYCKAARTAEETPRKVAQRLSCLRAEPEGSAGEFKISMKVTKVQKALVVVSDKRESGQPTSMKGKSVQVYENYPR